MNQEGMFTEQGWEMVATAWAKANCVSASSETDSED
jgi:hypothetical protein